MQELNQGPLILKDFKISEDKQGKYAIRDDLSITVSNDGDSKIRHRRTIKPFKTGSEIRTSVLVCNLDDVYLYVGNDGNLLMTKNAKLS